EAGLPYIAVLTHPTTGGVSASLAMLGDINIAEPEALIGFAGPRVIEQTVRETLPEGFQRSEFLLEHGAIDQICDRRALRDRIATLMAMMMKQPRPAEAACPPGRATGRRTRTHHDPQVLRHRRYPRPRRRGADFRRLRPAPGQCLRPRAGPRGPGQPAPLAQAGGDHRQ